MSRTTHLSIDVAGVLAMSKSDFNQQFEGVWSDDDGRIMGVAEVRQHFEDAKAKGYRVIPSTSECVGFDYQTGCPGHKDPWEEMQRQRIERLTVVGKIKDSKQCQGWLAKRGFRIVQSGPYTDREMHPSVDMKRFKFIAEREDGTK